MNFPTKTVLCMVLAAWAFGRAPHAQATTMCVADAASLNNALNIIAPLATEPLTVRIEQGIHAIGDLDAKPATSLTLAGGYVPGTNCSQRNANPALTTLDMGGAFVRIVLEEGTIAIEGLTLRHGQSLLFLGGADAVVNITIKRVRMTGFKSIQTSVTGGKQLLENVAIDSIASESHSCAVTIADFGDSYTNIRFLSAAMKGDEQFCLTHHDGTAQLDLVDSLIWKTSPNAGPTVLTPINFNGSYAVHVINTGFWGLNPATDPAVVAVTNQIFNIPNWVDASNGDLHLAPPTSTIDAGTTQIPRGSVPPTDIEGNPRPFAGSRPDPGAYEYQAPSVPSTVVTNNNDSGPGSLRQAVSNANLNGGGEITFNLSGAFCPHVIALSSPLDPITAAVTIDGRSQPGSTANTSENAFDAAICVALVPASPSVQNALKVASNAPDAAALTVDGLFFGAFNQPLMLLGGANHRIVGNQFGGTIGGVTLPGAGTNAIVIGGDATGALTIGGDNPSDRNVIGGANGPLAAGIRVQTAVAGCQIVNNMIGLDPDGKTARPNSTGIDLTGSGCDLRGNRVAYSTANGIWIQGDVNRLEGNSIGLNALGQVAGNGGYVGETAVGYGIRVSGSNNVIGLDVGHAYDGQAAANDIRANAQGGIGITSGTGNVVRGNIITANGVDHDGLAMDIDLAGDGITHNLVPNPASGPNGLQNHPVITGISYATMPNLGQANVVSTVFGIMYGSPGKYNIDVYFAQSKCEMDGRGHADSYIASKSVVIGPGENSQTFSIQSPMPIYFPPDSIVANATAANGNSSEFGNCAVQDTIFASGSDY